MAEAKARLTLKDVRASVSRMQNEGERLVARLRRDARSFAGKSRRDAVTTLLNETRKLQSDFRVRAERAIKELESRRTRLLASLEEQVQTLAERVVKGLNVATSDEVNELRKRINELERRIERAA